MRYNSSLKLLRVAAVVSVCIVLAGCAISTGSSKKQLLATSKGQLELRSIQSRVFDTTDREKTLRTIIATMQDLGFVIDDANYDLGSVSGTKLDNFQLRMSATVRPHGKTQLLVRAGMQFNVTQVDDPEPYQQFFTALHRAMFLEAQEGEIEKVATATNSRVGLEKSPSKGEERTTSAQKHLRLAPSIKQATPISGNWILGEWVGIRESQWWREEVTIRIASYDHATHAFKGDGIVLADPKNKTAGPSTDLFIEAVVNDEGKVVMTIHEGGGSSSSFNLKRERGSSLSGATSYGLPRLTLEKKR